MNAKLEDEFKKRCQPGHVHEDIWEHLPTLAELARKSAVIAEFGVRTGNSTIAFMAGMEMGTGGVIHSYDLNPPDFPSLPLEKTKWCFTQGDTGSLEDIPPCDLLFIDTLHTADQIRKELVHCRRASRVLIHDVVTWGTNGERGEPGINGPINDYLDTHPEWEVEEEWENNNGLLLLKRK